MRFMILPALLAALTLALAGCGGSSSSSDAAATDEVTTEETVTDAMTDEETVTDAMTDEETATDAMTDESTDAMETDASGVDTSGVDFSNLSGECKKLIEAMGAYGQALAAGGDTSNFNLEDTSKALQAVADAAPSDIKDSFQVLASAIAKYADALQGVDLSSAATDPATIQKMTEAAQSFNSTDVQNASQAITAWSNENCK